MADADTAEMEATLATPKGTDMTPEQAAAVAKIREALAEGTDYAFEMACDHASVSALLAALDAAQAAVTKWETTLSAVMPADFKDWHQNSRAEWPEVAAWVIQNLREREAEAWKHVDRINTAAQAPREAPRLTPEQIDDEFKRAGGRWVDGSYWQIEDADLQPCFRAVEARVRELCGVAP